MQDDTTRSAWLQWLGWVWVGVLAGALGVLEMLLLTGSAALVQWSASGFPVVALGALLYLLLPGLASFLAARQSRDASSGLAPGCLVGGVGFFILVALFTLDVISSPVCQPGPNHACGLGFSNELSAVAVGAVVSVFLVEGVGGMMGSMVGAWFGSNLGERWASRPQKRSGSAAPGASPGEARGQ